MTPPSALGASLRRELEPLITREIAGIAAIDTAIAHRPAPDYVVMFQDAKNDKQANVEQLATLVRIHGDSPDESGGIRKVLTKTQVAISSRLSTMMTLRAMQVTEIELVRLYSEALNRSDGLVRRTLTKTLGRALIHTHLLTAHLAKGTGSKADADLLPSSLDDYFVGVEPRACLRCHLDRPGAAGALERRDPHPYTYICAACHDEVLGEFTPDLAVQIDRWPKEIREATAMQHAIGRVSKLTAMRRVLYPLAGIDLELPAPAAERALIVPPMTRTPGPAPGERAGVVEIETAEGLEGEYVRELFSPRRIWHNW